MRVRTVCTQIAAGTLASVQQYTGTVNVGVIGRTNTPPIASGGVERICATKTKPLCMRGDGTLVKNTCFPSPTLRRKEKDGEYDTVLRRNPYRGGECLHDRAWHSLHLVRGFCSWRALQRHRSVGIAYYKVCEFVATGGKHIKIAPHAGFAITTSAKVERHRHSAKAEVFVYNSRNSLSHGQRI